MASAFAQRAAILSLAVVFALMGPAEADIDSAPPQSEDFAAEAKAALDGENWNKLEELARTRLEADDEDPAARAYLAFALAGSRQFEEAAAELVALDEAGYSPDGNVPGVGQPIGKIVNIIYMTCWANFNADYNLKAWSPLMNAFRDSPNMAVPASRVLMGRLIKGDAEGAQEIMDWFDEKLDAAGGNSTVRHHLCHHYARGFLRANQAPPRAVELAAEAYELAWEGAKAAAVTINDPLAKRERCDVNSDHEYWDLALACALSNRFDAPDNPLAERETEPGALFEDATGEVGLGKLNSGRVAAADYNDDGFVDLCFGGRLFRNEKGKRFVEVTKEAGLTRTGTGALFADFDNDGRLDILVTAHPHPSLFQNLGKRKKFVFKDVTKDAGLDKLVVGASPDGAAAMDIDNDGWLDFYLAPYENPYPKGHPDLLARNNGDGTFSDVSESSGIRTSGALVGRGVTCADYDDDGDRDIYVSNYRLLANQLWRNDGDGLFTDIAPDSELHGLEQKGSFGHTIGSCWGDVDNDGDLDLFCANLAHPRFITQGFSNLSMLYINSGKEGGYTFVDERRSRGIRFQETHSDPALTDYDNDGDLDLFITAIYVGAPSMFYQNDGEGFFEPVTFRSRSVVFNGWGQAWIDMDNDGDLDHAVGSSSGVAFHRNQGNDNSWLRVRLAGKKQNHFGVGSRVTVTTPDGLCQTREMRVGQGTTSQNGYVLHFGLGHDVTEAKVKVLWPTGNTSKRATKVNRTIEMRNSRAY